jgi:hypothetical protein
MDRRVLVSAMVALSFALGCGRSAQEQAARPAEPAPPPPPAPAAAAPETRPAKTEYRKVKGEIAVIRIGNDGQPDAATLEIEEFKKNETTIVWVADCGAEALTVTFKQECDGEPKPENIKNPPCQGIACAIDAKRVDPKKTIHLCYNVILTLPGQSTPITIDPKLIINP